MDVRLRSIEGLVHTRVAALPESALWLAAERPGIELPVSRTRREQDIMDDKELFQKNER